MALEHAKLNNAARIEAINVSYRVDRRISGALHQDSNYSKPHEFVAENGKKTCFRHIRKPLKAMSANEIEAIVDDRVRAFVKAHLEKCGGDLKKAFGDVNNHPYFKTRDGRIIPIHKARVRKNEATITVGAAERQRHVSPGSNHHMEIVALLGPDGQAKRWEGHLVSLFEAARRVRSHEPVICRDHGPGKKFLFSLAGGEYIIMEHQPGQPRLYRVVGISEKVIEFRLHTDGRPVTVLRKLSRARITRSPGALMEAQARKVAIDPLGNVLPAND